MEIKNYTNAISAYKGTALENTRRESQKASSTPKNMDKVEFSSTKLVNISALKASITQKVEGSSSFDRISGLKNLIQSGEYNIPSEIIAKAMTEF